MAVDPTNAQPQADAAAPQQAPQQAAPDQSQQAAPQPDVTASTEGTDAGSPAPQGSTADLESKVSQNIAARAANDADQRPRTGLFARILYGAMSHLEGAGKGLATGGIPGAVEGAISPNTAATHYQQKEQIRQNTVDKQQADIANSIADAHLREQQAANYPAELQQRRNEDDSKTVLGLKAYSVNPLGAVHDADSAGAMAQQLLQQNKMPWVLNPDPGTFLVYDMGQVAGTPMGLQDYNLAAAFNGMPTYEPDQWMNPKMGQIRTSGLKFAQGFLHPDVKNLMQADQMISKYQGIVKGIDSGSYSNIPADAKNRIITTLGEMVEAHNNYLSEMTKMRTAPANARFYKVDYSDGTVDYLTGPQAHALASGGASTSNNPAPGAPGQPQPNAARTPINPSLSVQMQMASTPDGRQVAGTPEEMAAAGLHGVKMGGSDQTQVLAARQLIAPNGLFHSIANDMAVLEKQGKLGVVASRWNDFLSSKVGTGPEFTQFRNDMKLASTRLMQAHVGLRGSHEMLEHFGSLADYRISDAPTLKAALHSEFEYAKERAAFIPKAQPQQAQ